MTRFLKTFLLPALLFGGLFVADMPSADAFGGRGAARRAARRATPVVASPSVVQSTMVRATVVQAPVVSYRVQSRAYAPVQVHTPATMTYQSYQSNVGIMPTPIFSRTRHTVRHW